MGYETTFRLKGGLDDQFKTWMNKVSQSDLTKYKVVLEGICMLPVNRDERDRSFTYLDTLYGDIRMGVAMYVKYIVEKWKVSLKARINDKNEIWFCGWEFSDSARDSLWDDEDDLTDFYTEQLFLDVIQPTQGAFEYKNEDYHIKLQQVSDTIKGIEDSVYDMMNHKFVERYRDSEDAYESDGYSRLFPEEKDDDDIEESKKTEETVEDDSKDNRV